MSVSTDKGGDRDRGRGQKYNFIVVKEKGRKVRGMLESNMKSVNLVIVYYKFNNDSVYHDNRIWQYLIWHSMIWYVWYDMIYDMRDWCDKYGRYHMIEDNIWYCLPCMEVSVSRKRAKPAILWYAAFTLLTVNSSLSIFKARQTGSSLAAISGD